MNRLFPTATPQWKQADAACRLYRTRRIRAVDTGAKWLTNLFLGLGLACLWLVVMIVLYVAM